MVRCGSEYERSALAFPCLPLLISHSLFFIIIHEQLGTYWDGRISKLTLDGEVDRIWKYSFGCSSLPACFTDFRGITCITRNIIDGIGLLFVGATDGKVHLFDVFIVPQLQDPAIIS